MTQATAQQRQPEEGIEPDDLDTKMIVTIGLLSTFLLVASVLGVTALVDQFQAAQTQAKQYDMEGVSISYGDPDEELGNQRQSLNGYAASAAEPGKYLIPIDRAKNLVLRELRAGRDSTGDGRSGSGRSGGEGSSDVN